MAAVKADYQLNKKISFGIGSDFLSGKDMNSGLSTISYFNPLYGTHHKFYGSMDYFYGQSGHNNVGLRDYYLNFSYNISDKAGWQFSLHHFEAAATVIDYTGVPASSSLANEADVSFKYEVMKDVKLRGGYSQMFENTSMRYVKNISPFQKMKSFQNWVWLSININPDILIFKSKAQ